jgi:hypothetical protein
MTTNWRVNHWEKFGIGIRRLCKILWTRAACGGWLKPWAALHGKYSHVKVAHTRTTQSATGKSNGGLAARLTHCQELVRQRYSWWRPHSQSVVPSGSACGFRRWCQPCFTLVVSLPSKVKHLVNTDKSTKQSWLEVVQLRGWDGSKRNRIFSDW